MQLDENLSPDNPVYLTPRERDVLRLIGQSKFNKEIAGELGISVNRNQFGDGSGVFINSANSNIYGYQLWTQQRYGLQIYACGGPNSGSYFCTSLG